MLHVKQKFPGGKRVRGKLVFVSINLIGESPSRGGISDITCITCSVVLHSATYGNVWHRFCGASAC